MTNTNITAARANFYKLADSCLDFNDVININTKKGNVVLLSEEEYSGMLETIHLYGVPGLVETIDRERKQSTEKFEEFRWK